MATTLLTNTTAILTMNAGSEIVEDGEILITEGKITAIGRQGTLNSKGASRLDAKRGIVLPGLINAHAHLPMSFFRGICHSRPEILYEVVYPIEKHLTPAEIYPLTLISLLETTRTGVTCSGDHYFFEEEVAKAIRDVGVRAALGEHISSSGGPLSGPDTLERGLSFAVNWIPQPT